MTTRWKWVGTREYLSGLLTCQLETIPPNPSIDLRGCTVLLTGATGGLGLECARQLYDSRPSKLILGVRNVELGHKLQHELEDPPRSTLESSEEVLEQPVVEVMQIDQSSFQSVKSFAARLQNEPLDVVLLNAGFTTWEWILTEDGYEKSLQINHLSTALLGILLLPMLRRTANVKDPLKQISPPRLTFVSSDGHYLAPLSYAQIPGLDHNNPAIAAEDKGAEPIYEYLGDITKWDKTLRYSDTKLLLLLFARQLAEKTPPSECIVSSVHPGFVCTQLFRDVGTMNRVAHFWPVKRFFSRPVEQGAASIVNAAVLKGQESHGRFLSECKVRDESAFVRSDEGGRMQNEVWKETMMIFARILGRQVEI
ncbi:hypothetical protein MMC20_003336 [Loxospora ochrophaea]|nr:hypothetical protein [Loxospora ochrophaea]